MDRCFRLDLRLDHLRMDLHRGARIHVGCRADLTQHHRLGRPVPDGESMKKDEKSALRWIEMG